MTKLTENHIQQLYNFTKQHYVEWYDVQTELVDHLANGIEQQWQTQPNISFETALQNEFKKFGVLGFSEVVEQKTSALNKHYRRLVWNSLREYFKLPKVLFTLVLVLAIWQIFYVSSLNFIIFTIIGFLLVFQFLLFRYLYVQHKKNKRLEKQTGKKLLINRTLLGWGDLLQIANLFLWYPITFAGIYNSTYSFLEQSQYQLLVALLIVILIFALHVATSVVPKKISEKIMQQYPDYKTLLL